MLDERKDPSGGSHTVLYPCFKLYVWVGALEISCHHDLPPPTPHTEAANGQLESNSDMCELSTSICHPIVGSTILVVLPQR